MRHSRHHFGQSSLASKFLTHLHFVLEIFVIRQKALKHSASFSVLFKIPLTWREVALRIFILKPVIAFLHFWLYLMSIVL